MLFNYIEVLIFFPVADMLYFLLPFHLRWVLLLTASYFFYGYRNPRYLLLIFLSTFLHYLCGIMMGQTDNKAKRHPYLHLGVVGNLGLLFPFKYSGFFTRPIGAGFSLLGFHTSLPVMENLPPQRQGSLLVMLP